MNFEKPKKQNFEKIKNNYWRYHYFTYVYQKPHPYEVQFLRYGVRQNSLSFWAIFCPFTPHNPENQNFEKIKKASETCATKKNNHMIYVYSDMGCNRQVFVILGLGHSLLFYPTIDAKN